jgi:hypothetical protein
VSILMNIKMLGMANCTKGSGIKKLETEMVLVYSFGLMDQSMKVCGDKIRQQEREE